LALSKGDTVQALGEMDLAAQMSPNDPATAFVYGKALIYAGHDREALEQLQRSAKLDPYFAAPHLLLGFIYDGSDYRDEAIAEFKMYIALAMQDDPYLAKAHERLTALSPLAGGKP
jgi:Flp pilus assembly protein TadD